MPSDFNAPASIYSASCSSNNNSSHPAHGPPPNQGVAAARAHHPSWYPHWPRHSAPSTQLALHVNNPTLPLHPHPAAMTSAHHRSSDSTTFKIASTVVIAVLRFQSYRRISSHVDSSLHHPYEVCLDLGSVVLPETTDQVGLPFSRDFVQSVAGIVRNHDLQKLNELGGIQGLAKQLQTDLMQGLPASAGHHHNLHGSEYGTTSTKISLEDRRRIFGENAYPRKKGKSLWGFLWDACHDTTLNILMLCAALSLGFGMKSDGIKEGWYDGVSIAVAILLVIIVTGVSDYRQSRQFRHLSEERDNIKVQVTRGGRQISIALIGIVVGDIVQLNTGDQVPADGLLVHGQSLSIDESSLTGESEYYIPDAEEHAFLHSGSKIQDGYGSMLVVSVGTNTEWGSMMALLSNDNNGEQTPLQARLTKAATLIGKVGLSVALLVLIILITFYFTGHSSTSGDAQFQPGQTSVTDAINALVHIFSIAVTIVVVAVPEGLPLAVTLTLAYSMRKMMKDNALVRHLAACETMGSATTICSDKTGTLTTNQMTVVKSWVAGKMITCESDEAEIMHTLPGNLQSLLFQGIAQNSTGIVLTSQPFRRQSESMHQLGLLQAEVVGSPTERILKKHITLAYSMRKMMKDNALVRHLAACETMGSATTICSDKTGTLTTNQMTVVKSWVAGKMITCESDEAEIMHTLPRNLQSLLFQGIAQNSTGIVFTSQPFRRQSESMHQLGLLQAEVVGSPTEAALLWWGLKAGMNFQASRSESSILKVETFHSAKKRAGVAVETSNKQFVVVHWKGAAEIILSMCSKWVDMQELEGTDAAGAFPCEKSMSMEKRQEILAVIESMASHTLRCVALAYTIMPQENAHAAIKLDGHNWSLPDSDLTFLAVVGMKDPCRPEVKAAVSAVKAAGVTVRMVTGDNLETAKAIAMECGILDIIGTDSPMAVEGTVLRGWTEDERRQNLPRVAVIARALPSDKLLLVETLQSMGEVVAVTGDGTNDAPALHRADIGLSMGIQGTEVAKESSDIIILDDNFASVVKVVRWGRSVNFNIQKFLQFQLTVNVTALGVNFVAAVSSGDVPLTVVQLLWVNLIMDTLGALALATEPPTDELMQKPPVGRKEPLITNTMWRNLAAQAIYQLVILLTLQFRGVELLQLSGEKDADTINHTVIFNTFVFCQLFNEMNARQPYRRNIFHGLQHNRLFMGIVAITIVLQVVMVEFLEKFASTIRLDWQQWLVCIGLASLSWPIALLVKLIPVVKSMLWRLKFQ